MRRNILTQRLRDGETIIGTMVQEIQTPGIAQILEQIGFDFFMIDMESGAFNLETATNILRVGRLVNMCPLVRVASPEYHLIARVLDQGAMGVMLPRVEMRHEVEMLVETMKYPPMGKRGFASSAPHTDYLSNPVPTFLAANNQETLVIAQIELREAVDHIDDILAVPGIHVALVGPQDLSISLGVPGETGHPIVENAIDRVLVSAQEHNVVPGIHMGNIAPLKMWMEKGMRMIILGSDLGFLMSGGRDSLAQLRKSN